MNTDTQAAANAKETESKLVSDVTAVYSIVNTFELPFHLSETKEDYVEDDVLYVVMKDGTKRSFEPTSSIYDEMRELDLTEPEEVHTHSTTRRYPT